MEKEKRKNFKPAFRSLKGGRLCMDYCCTCVFQRVFFPHRWFLAEGLVSVMYFFFLVYVNSCFGPSVFKDTMAEQLTLYFAVSRHQT